jgi:hypothetical protein
MDDLILDEGQLPCDGWSGMTISITETDNDASNTHSFEIWVMFVKTIGLKVSVHFLIRRIK